MNVISRSFHRSFLPGPCRFSLAALLMIGTLEPALAQLVTRLSKPLPRIVEGQVLDSYEFTPDGTHVLFIADRGQVGRNQLFIAPVDGSSKPRRLGPLPDHGVVGVAYSFDISPDGSTVVVYYGPKTLNSGEPYELYRVAVDGGTKPELLLDTNDRLIFQYEISPDGQRVVLLSHLDTYQVYELYVIPLAGGPTLKLNPALPSGRDVESFRIDASSTRVAYSADQDTDDRSYLYSAPIDGSSAAIRLSHDMTGTEELLEFQLAGDRAVYRASAVSSHDVYGVPLDGSSAAARLNASIPGDVYVLDFLVTPDSSRVVFRADQVPSGMELYSIPTDASSAVVKLNGSLVAGGDVWWDYEITPDGSHVVYVADQLKDDKFELFSAPIATAAAAVKLNGTMTGGGDVTTTLSRLVISPDNTRVLYVADQETNEVWEAFSAKLDGSSNVKLNDALLPGYSCEGLAISPDSATAVFRTRNLEYVGEMFSTPIEGGANTLLAGSGTHPDNVIDPAGARVVFRTAVDDGFHLMSRPLDASEPAAQLDYLLPGVPVGIIDSFELSPDEHFVVYRGIQDERFDFELYSVPLVGGDPVKLNGPLLDNRDVYDFAISGDGQRVLYSGDEDEESAVDLYSVPIDGSSSRVRVSSAAPPGGGVVNYASSADGQWALYLSVQENLFATPIDGSGGPIQLNTPSAGIHDVDRYYRSSPSSDHVVYLAETNDQEQFELYSVPIDGSSAPVKLSHSLANDHDVIANFKVSADGLWVVYLAGHFFKGPVEAFSVPIDGSAAPAKLNGPLVPGGSVGGVLLSPKSDRVVYTADELTDGVFEHFSAPIDGGLPSVRLNGDLPAPPASGGVAITPDGTHALYRFPQDTPGLYELYSVPITGGPSTKISNSSLSVGGFTVAPRSDLVVYTLVTPAAYAPELLTARVDGSASPVLISTLPVGRTIQSVQVSGNGRRVAYRADAEVEDQLEVYEVGILGSPSPRRMNGPFVPNADVAGFRMTHDGFRIVYLADQRSDDDIELFASQYVGPIGF